MRLPYHIISSSVISSVVYILTQSFILAITTFFSGILIDIDHFIDYFVNEKKIKFDIKDFFYKCDNCKLEKAILILHSYEIMFVFLLCLFVINVQIYKGIVIGFLSHFMIDVLWNLTKGYSPIQCYSFIFRSLQKFEYKKIFFNNFM